MRKAMSDRAHRQLRERRAVAWERGRRAAEVRLAAEIAVAFPELSRSECLHRAREKIEGEGL